VALIVSSASVTSGIIFGLQGPMLTEEEKSFFRDVEPLGYILFSRNIEEPDQLRYLTSSLREISSHEHVPILIDQEGGRVARLRPPFWRETFPAGCYADLARRNLDEAQRAVYINHQLIAYELLDLGINVNCAPVIDLQIPGASDIIGDRAFGVSVKEVVSLGREAAKGLMDAGVLAIMKHIPGHGRAEVDSHLELPRIGEAKDQLMVTDFSAFRELSSDIPWAMTAHIIYSAIDDIHPATLSGKIIKEIIRGYIGFDGFLISDDLGMKALSGDLAMLARQSLVAGCDAVLHCSGIFDEMKQVAKGVDALSDLSKRRLNKGWQCIKENAYIDAPGLRQELASLLQKR